MAFGVDANAIRDRKLYLPLEVGKPPDFVLEVASESTTRQDIIGKRLIYAQIGVPEYWRLDPTGGDHYGQPLEGERLIEGVYRPIDLTTERTAFSRDTALHWLCTCPGETKGSLCTIRRPVNILEYRCKTPCVPNERLGKPARQGYGSLRKSYAAANQRDDSPSYFDCVKGIGALCLAEDQNYSTSRISGSGHKVPGLPQSRSKHE